MRILVTPSGTEIGHEIWRSLHRIKDVHLIGANSTYDASAICFDQFVDNVPFANNPGYAAAIVQIVNELDIDFVIPAHDDATVALSAVQSELSAKLVCSPSETVKIARSKLKTYEALRDKVRVPEVYDRTRVRKFPVIVKPDIGQGSKGVKLCQSREELDSFLAPGSFACEYLPGAEYTVDCVSDADGNILFVGPRERKSVRNGIATSTEPMHEKEEFHDFAVRIAERVKFIGAWFFQVKRTYSGDLCLLEIAVRIAGSMALNRMLGVNFSELSLAIHNGLNTKCIEQTLDIRMERSLSVQFDVRISIEEVYIDFDDCVFMNRSSLNTDAIAFIARCRNEDRKVVLISRHAGDLGKCLADLGIGGLIDEIIHITDDQPKSSFIKSRAAIFIDDSFRERLDVSEKCGIPVFGVDALAALASAKLPAKSD